MFMDMYTFELENEWYRKNSVEKTDNIDGSFMTYK
jgi:hypothetical protein